MSFSFFLAFFVCVALTTQFPFPSPLSAADVMKVASLNSRGDAAFADGYAGDILRLRLKPEHEWVFEVPEVIVAASVPEAQLHVQQQSVDPASTVVQHGDSTLTLSRTEDTLHFTFAAHGTVLTTGSVDLMDVQSPRLTVAFPAAKRMYGVPEHTLNLAMHGGEKYDLFNSDSFQYPMSSGAPKYGSIPFVMAYSAAATTGLLFLNASEMRVEVLRDSTNQLKWTAEVGVTDLFFLPGPTPAQVQRQHATLTGSTFFPPYSMLGYHQCRWNYTSTEDCISVDKGMDGNDLPYDVLWLDVEHTDGKKYFTWDRAHFPDPQALVDYLVAQGRELVTIKDPHVKTEKGYVVYDEGIGGGHFIRDTDGTTVLTGKCWPGQCSWPDFVQERTRDWYATFFHDDRCEYGGRHVYTWVDMNEPAVFEGYRQQTMKKDAVHHTDDGRVVQHRAVHNVYGFLAVMAAHKGCMEAAGPTTPPERPFLLTRSFFAGTQRMSAIWAGDNMSRWDHLKGTPAELLGLALCNMPFTGADVGGFLGEPSEELFVRWMQAGVFYPFFRGHSEITTRRREPYVWALEARQHIREALHLRYTLIPYLYTTFYHAHVHGDAVIRPLFYEFPAEESLADVEESYLFGPSLLVHPVLDKGAKEVSVELPLGATWYSYPAGDPVAFGTHRVPVTMASIPMFLRGGHILPTKQHRRRSTAFAKDDPFTLYVALNPNGTSDGLLYMDDGRTFAYQRGMYAYRRLEFSASTGQLRCRAVTEADGGDDGRGEFHAANTVERVVFFGLKSTPTKVTAKGVALGVTQCGSSSSSSSPTVVVVDCGPVALPVTEDWVICVE